MRSLSVQQKRRFEAKGTHLERHGIDDSAGDGKRITGEDARKSVAARTQQRIAEAACRHGTPLLRFEDNAHPNSPASEAGRKRYKAVLRGFLNSRPRRVEA